MLPRPSKFLVKKRSIIGACSSWDWYAKLSAQIASVLNIDQLCEQVTGLIQSTFSLLLRRHFHPIRRSSLAAVPRIRFMQRQPTAPAWFFHQNGRRFDRHGCRKGRANRRSGCVDPPAFPFHGCASRDTLRGLFPAQKRGCRPGCFGCAKRYSGWFSRDRYHGAGRVGRQHRPGSSDRPAVHRYRTARRPDFIRRGSESRAQLHPGIRGLLNEVVKLIQRRFNYPYVHIFSVHSGRRMVIFQAGGGERSRPCALPNRVTRWTPPGNHPVGGPQWEILPGQ